MFVSATALFPARLPDDMDLTKRFEEATAYASVNVNALEPHKLYPIIRAKRIPTKYGLSVVLTLRIAESKIVQVFLPKRYTDVVSDADIDAINSKAVSLHLVYKGVCESSKSYFLAIEFKIYTFRTHRADMKTQSQHYASKRIGGVNYVKGQQQTVLTLYINCVHSK